MMNRLVKRRTYKVIGDPAAPVPAPPQDHVKFQTILSVAGNAPFHYACGRQHQGEQKSPVPWRAHVLDAVQCRTLMHKLMENGDASKVPAMLAASHYLVQVTWLPDHAADNPASSASKDIVFAGTLRNMEHLAAAAAFTQSLLLAAEEEDYRTYWSSGGALRGGKVFEWLGIPANQLLIGSVFFFPQDTGSSQIKAGAMRDKRGDVTQWSRHVSIS